MRPDGPGNGGPGHRSDGGLTPWAGAERPRHQRRARRKPGAFARAGARPGVLAAGLVLGLTGLSGSVLGIAHQFLPRTFSPAQRQQIMAWEVAKRWRAWPAGRIFPRQAGYHIPGTAFGGGPGLTLTAQRVGIAGQAACGAATASRAARVLASSGCQTVLRATYVDKTQTIAVTVGIAVLASPEAARHAQVPVSRLSGGQPVVRVVAFARTPVSRFGGSGGLLSADRLAGPYLVLAAVGYSNGRPWLAGGNDAYTRAEMLGVASGVDRSVAASLAARPPQPHCPGSPAC